MPGEIVLVNVSGEDKPGLLGMLTSTLARYQARVLDVGQAVIHDELNLGLLLEADPDALHPMLHALDACAVDSDIRIRTSMISGQRYDDWVRQQGKPRYIVTLLARGIEAEQLTAVTAVVERYGLNIDGIRRLSGRIPRDGSGRGRASVEMSLRGDVADPAGLKAALLEVASRLDFDASVQEDTVYRRNRRLVVFDMDSTLIQVEVIDELARRKGVHDAVAEVTAAAMRGEIDFAESFRRRLELLEGLPATALEEVAASVRLTDGADRLIAALKRFGYRTAIVSGGFRYVGERLKAELGIDYVFANDLEIVDGRITGRPAGAIVDAERKAAILASLCERECISLHQAIAIGDGANDLPMLGAAGLGVAFHAKPVVARSAGHVISNFGLDGVLYLMGFSDRDIDV